MSQFFSGNENYSSTNELVLISESKINSKTRTVRFPNKWTLWASSFQWIQTKQCRQNSLTSEGMTRHLFRKCFWFTKNNQIIKHAQLTNQCIWIKSHVMHMQKIHMHFFSSILWCFFHKFHSLHAVWHKHTKAAWLAGISNTRTTVTPSI